ncbi:BLUF domain-containing protein [Azohydromonas australica]|uniref:BLUF domain-containing protein n=1 Tax=Azohydromonas australica TaxID=364039 RepID=UPI000428F02C|nr:BLUF domain-containing protein [Azohydromonas australica]
MALYQVVYISMVSRDEPTRAELQALLATSVRRNRALGVTGMLLYARGGFMQLLEGEEEAVKALFDRVRRDDRHRRVTVLVHGPVAERTFADWAMAYRCLDDEAAADPPAQDDGLPAELAPLFQQGFDESRLRARPGVALELLRHYSRNNGLAVA